MKAWTGSDLPFPWRPRPDTHTLITRLSEFQSHRQKGSCDSPTPNTCRHCDDEESDIRNEAFQALYVARAMLERAARGLADAERIILGSGAAGWIGSLILSDVEAVLTELGSGATPAHGDGATPAVRPREPHSWHDGLDEDDLAVAKIEERE